MRPSCFTCPNPQLHGKPSAPMTPDHSLCVRLADFVYLYWRALLILCSMLAAAFFTQSDAAPLAPNQLHSEFVTAQNFTQISPDPVEHAALLQKVHGKLRMLRLVIDRLPKHFTPFKTEPKYKLTYYVEKLECGHERFAFAHDSTAKRRHCGVCALAASLPEKKAVGSVVLAGEQKRAGGASS